MRQGAVLLGFSLIAMIAGCGGAGTYTKSVDSSANTNVSSAGSAGTTNPSAGAGVSGTSSAPGTSSSSGSSTTGGSSSGSTSSGGSTTSGGSSTGGTSTGNPPAAPAPTPTSATEVVINSPAEGATVSSPTAVSATATGEASITSMQLYVDDGVAFQAESAQINTSLNLPAGPHTIVAQAWDQNGSAFKSAPLHVVVQAPATPPAPAPAPAPSAPSPTIGQIQTQGGWDDCDVCAGDAGNGPHTAHGMQRGVSSPSLSGASTRFDIGGTPWGAALFWLELGSHDDAQNLRYDLDFYIDSTSSAQALEFDVNQTANGNRYIFGTECDFRGTGTWRVWNGPAHTWASTGIGCPMPEAGTWHHLTWEFQRSGGQAHFIAVTLDGNRHDVVMAFDGLGQSGSGLDVAFQADLNASGGNVSVWLDNVGLSW